MVSSDAPRITLPQLIRQSLVPEHDDALIERGPSGWVSQSSTRVLERVQNVACALRAMGLQRGDRVALISQNRADWIIADFGILMAGLVVVPIFPTQALDQVQFILENSEAKAVFVDTLAAAERLRTIPNLPPLIIFDAQGDESLAALEARGASVHGEDRDLPAAYERELEPDDLAILIYTSGTTGMPKGVMLTHDNLAWNSMTSFSYGLGAVGPGDPVMSVLPFSHIYEHHIIYGFMHSHVRFFICHHPDELLRDLKEVRPYAMTAVPRIFERIIAGITGMAMKEGGARAKLVPWALGIGRDYMSAKLRGHRPSPALAAQFALANALVLKKIKPRLGLDRLKFFVSGSAPLHFDTAMTLLGFGVTIIEGYGPTECSPVITVNRLVDNRYGTVGKPIPGVEVKIAEDGEILVRGRNVMRGYYKDEAASATALEGGWYHTGDVGQFDADGYLRITDRKKELFKTSGGKFIAPARVESAIKRSVFISQVLVVGESRAHPAALVAPNWDLVRTELGIAHEVPIADLLDRNDVCELITKEVRNHTADLATFEQIRRVVLLPRELTIEDGELSPTLKVKRRVVEQKYAPQIERAYAASLHT